MALKSIIPRNSHLAVIGGIFKAVLNTPTAGKYNFTDYAPATVRYNVAVDLGLVMNANYFYFFHQMSFSLSMAEQVYLSAIDPGTVPTLSVLDSTTRKNVFSAPFRMLRYFENAAVDSYHYSMQRDSRFIANFEGRLIQTADLVGVSDVYAQVSFTVYEIGDPSFKEQYLKEGKK